MNIKEFSALILEYWYFLEFLGQPDFPTQNRTGKDECCKAQKGKSKRKQISVFEPLNYCDLICKSCVPIQISAPNEILKIHNEIYKQHPIVSDEIALCLGKSKRNVFAEKLSCFFDRELEIPEKNQHTVGLIGLKCDQDGHYIPHSLNISPLAWSIHRLITTRDSSTLADLLSIDSYHAEMYYLEKLLVFEDNGKLVGELLTLPLLKTLVKQIYQDHLSAIWSSIDSIIWDGTLISHRYTTEDIKATDIDTHRESELFRSFFAEDLQMTSKAVLDREFGRTPMQQAFLQYICGQYAEERPELGWLDTSKRVNVFSWNKCDLSEQMDFFHDQFNIARAPLGKWPSRFLPGFMQQMAINSSWDATQNNQPIFSVNGPPGTGKTTLLKEVISGNIVARAYKLAQYESPDDAFEMQYFKDGSELHNSYSRYHNAYYRFKDNSLKNYGILVASCNNAAVENITKELPNATALLKGLMPDEQSDPKIAQGLQDIQELFQIDSAKPETYQIWNTNIQDYESREIPDIYFTKFANDLANREPQNQDQWGLISAPFGKASNLKNYIQKVLKPYIKSFGQNDFILSKAQAYSTAAKRFLEQYKKVAALNGELMQICSARERYLKKKAELYKQIEIAEHEQKKAQITELQLQQIIQELAQTLEQAKEELIHCQKIAFALQDQATEHERRQQEFKTELEEMQQQIIRLEQSRRCWDYILEFFHTPSMLSKTIHEKYSVLDEIEKALQNQYEIGEQTRQQYVIQQKLCHSHETRINQIQTSHGEFLIKQKQCLEKQQQLLNQIAAYHQALEKALVDYKKCLQAASTDDPERRMTVLDDNFFALFNSENKSESCKAHTLNPWQHAEYNREREKLFFEALRLHKAFLLGSKSCLWNFKNLLLFWNEPRDDDNKPVRISERDRKAAFGDLLNTVFLLTPVISTTFASAGTMLSSIDKPGEIGCLIIDEAGQASPQMAIGSLFRSRRAIVVGDPKQVEPVVTDELDLIKQIIQNDNTRCYQSKSLSVQGFADRLNRIGTYYTDGPENLWVGCPLVVHRRCISPMFDISNALAYNHIMKQQTALPTPEKEATFCKDNSGWINVCGSEKNTASKDHYVETQGKKAWELILTAFKKTDGIPSLFVITPFTSVRDGLRHMILTQPEYESDLRIQEWADRCIGTVHTFQGKEADQVIFLLGCDKNSIPSVKWVNTNIVNVAVTRAKYRLYVIGDYLVWKESAIFCKVKDILDSYAIRALYEIAQNADAHIDRKQVASLMKQIPDAESLTVEGELDDRLLSPLADELSSLLQNATLTKEQWAEFGLSQEDITILPEETRKHLAEGILQHNILTTIKNQYKIELSDASGTGILFCKVMENLLKEQLFDKFKTYFSDLKSHKKLATISCQTATIGTITHLLHDIECLTALANKKVFLFKAPCDITWWNNYAKQLDAFRDLRNHCCHAEPFSWDQYKQMLHILFDCKEFMNTLVGEVLP